MDWLSSFIQHLPILAYGIVFLFSMLEGEISVLAFGVLSRGDYLDIKVVFLIVVIAATLHDVLFWYIGKRLSHSTSNNAFMRAIKKIGPALEQRRHLLPLFIGISKFAWNFNKVVLASNGYIHTPLKKTFSYSAIASFIWAALFLSLGYVFADQSGIFKKRIEVTGFLITIIIILILVFESYLREVFQKYVLNGSQESLDSDEKKVK